MDTPTILEDEFSEALARLDRAYKQLRAIHADMAHLNSDSAEYNIAYDNFRAAELDLWVFKDVFYRIFRAKRVEKGRGE